MTAGLPALPPVDPAALEPAEAEMASARARVAKHGPIVVRASEAMTAVDGLTSALSRGSMDAVRRIIAVGREAEEHTRQGLAEIPGSEVAQ